MGMEKLSRSMMMRVDKTAKRRGIKKNFADEVDKQKVF